MGKVSREEHSDQPFYNQLIFSLEPQSSRTVLAIVTIPSKCIDVIYREASLSQRNAAQTYGFHIHTVPLDYITHTYHANLIEHLKEFILKFFVIGFLYHELRHRSISLADDPKLVGINLEPHQDARYTFKLNLFPSIGIINWKYLPFKPPLRKRYKDLDRQVDSFVKEELTLASQKNDLVIEIGDWVLLSLSLSDKDNNILLDNYNEQFWLKIGHEEVDNTFREILCGKQIGDEIFTTNNSLQEYFSDQLDTNYNFCIKVLDIQPYCYFCFDQFKRHFRIKTNKEMHQKLIEVFSYRNDLSQRRAMAEEALSLLISKHPFTLPESLVKQQQKIILETMYRNPDYNVYRIQKDFKENIQQLSEKQVRESIFIDQMAYHENIGLTNQDVKLYLNFTKRPRMKEFMYFTPPSSRIGGQEMPIIAQELKQSCLREKTLNHIIYYLTKK